MNITKKSFQEIADDVLETHKELFENLASIERLEKTNPSQKELEIARWLLDNKKELSEKVQEHHNKAYHLLPDSLIDIYMDNFSNKGVDIIKNEIQDIFNLTPEEMCSILTKEFIKTVLGKEFLEPTKG